MSAKKNKKKKDRKKEKKKKRKKKQPALAFMSLLVGVIISLKPAPKSREVIYL